MDFEAEFEDKKVKGKIKEREEAKKEYEEEVAKGHTVAYSEISEDAKDIMKIKVGNLPAGKSVKIRFTYLQTLNVCMNKFWRFVLPSTITPRYHSDDHQIGSQDL